MAAVTITVRKDASYKIEGDVALVDHEGNPIPIPTGKPFFSLCRCGASSKKPFCDGTHTKIGFRAAEEAARAFDAGASPAAATAAAVQAAIAPSDRPADAKVSEVTAGDAKG